MKKRNIYPLVFLFVALFGMSSCYKDMGNYEYSEISDLVIDTVGMPNRQELQNASIGSRLNLKPTVTYSKSLDQLEYYWVIYPYTYRPVQEGNAIVYPQADTISRSHELDWIVDAAPGAYSMQFVTSDPENGLRSFFWFYMNIPNPGTKSGLYILSEFDGNTDIELYGSARALIIGGDHLTHKYYSSLHGGLIPGKPRFISWGPTYYYAFTEQTGLRLNVNGLMLMDDFNDMFYNVPSFNPQNLTHINNCEFFLNDGKLHVMYTNQANDRKFSAPVAGNYQAAPFLSRNTKTTWNPLPNAIGADQVVFDVNAKAFRPYFPRAASMSQFRPTVPDALIDVNNMGSTPIAIFEANGNQVYNIMKVNGVDSLKVIRFFNVEDDGDLSAGGNSRISLAGCEGISEAKFFASSLAGSAFFYATSNAVYSFSYTSGQTTQEDIYRCAPGEEITALYQMPSGGFPTAGCVLWIAVWNSQTNEGSLREYEVDPTSGRIRTYWTDMFSPHLENPHVTTGFGKIKQMVIKM
jgi:hypothetical protein